jgi:hypothetical protein
MLLSRVSNSIICRTMVVLMAAIAAMLALVPTALAQKQAYYTVKMPDAKETKKAGMAPEIEATIVGAGPGVPLDKFTLVQSDAKVPIPPMKALSKRDYTQGSETFALAVLVEGHKMWVGNETYEENQDVKYVGTLTKLAPLIDKLSKIGPPGSLGTIITYHQGVDIKLAMGPLSALTGAALGNQKDYENFVLADLNNGVIKALAELKKVTASRKALVVFGDGTDANPDVSKKALAELRKQATDDRVELFSVIFESDFKDGVKVIANLVPSSITAPSVDGLASAVDGIVARMNDRVYITFPGFDPKTKTGFTWDGKQHEMTLKIDQDELEPQSLVLSPPWRYGSDKFPWLLAVVLPLGALALIGVGVMIFRKKPVPVMVMAAAPLPDAPKSAGPIKTVMIGAGGDQDGFPIVGWVVALNGPNAFRTYKLQPGATRFGTGGSAHIVVNDGHLSTEHCQIACSPTGFQLQDLKSTNGCYVNERKVERHDLVDNDLITLGKTNFKFKSIN